jgi:hypothetical protein
VFRASSVPGYAGQTYKAALGSIQSILVGVPPANQLTQIRWFSVQDSPFNAVGDGVTDDTAAINACFAACNAAGGGTIRVPYTVNGYKISGQINWPSNCHIEADYALFTQTNPAADTLVLPSGFNDCRVVGLNINYAPYSTGGRAFVVPTGKYLRIEHLNVGQAWNIFTFTGSNIAVLIDDVNTSQQVNHPYGMTITGNVEEFHCRKWIAGTGTGSSTSVGMYIANGAGMTFDDCDIIGYAFGLVIDASNVAINTVPNPDGVNNIDFVNCSWDASNINAVRLAGANNTIYANISRVRFLGCWAAGSFSGSNFYISTPYANNVVDGVQIIGLKCYNGGIHGVEIEAGLGIVRNISVGSESHFGGNSQRVPGSYSGIYINGNGGGILSDVSVQNCRSGNAVGYNGGGAAGTQGYGITLGVATNSGIIALRNNDLSGNATLALNLSTANASTRISNNPGYNPVGIFTPITGFATGVVWTNNTGIDVDIVITGGATFTSVQIGGVSTGVSGVISGGGATIPVPAGQTMTPTWSSGTPVFVVSGR